MSVVTRESRRASAVLHVGGLHYASEKAVVERMLGRQPGVVEVEANPVAQTATVTFDPDLTSVEQLSPHTGIFAQNDVFLTQRAVGVAPDGASLASTGAFLALTCFSTHRNQRQSQ